MDFNAEAHIPVLRVDVYPRPHGNDEPSPFVARIEFDQLAVERVVRPILLGIGPAARGHALVRLFESDATIRAAAYDALQQVNLREAEERMVKAWKERQEARKP